MYECAKCRVFTCDRDPEGIRPDNCPMRDRDIVERSKAEYIKEENNGFFVNAAMVEAEGYGDWNRIRETLELCKRMGYRKIGLAFCIGFVKEAKILISIFEKHGFEVVSIACKNGAIDKSLLGIPEEAKIDGPGAYEPACNPVGQAMYLAKENVDFVVVLGLCVGHDSLFYKYISKYSDAFCTTIAVKDRATGHNPCAALYCAGGYFRNKFGDE